MNELQELSSVGGDFPITAAQGTAAIALTMAMKYLDISTVQDGTLYQQYKLEGRNLEPLSIDLVFETAMKIEMYLLSASDRIANLIVDAISVVDVEDEDADGPEEQNGDES